jgi:hypothetical protein
MLEIIFLPFTAVTLANKTPILPKKSLPVL